MKPHTPTPWAEWDVMSTEGKDEYPTAQNGDIRLIGQDKICMGIIFGGYKSLPDLDGNAAFIIRACNAHDELIEALTDLVLAHDGIFTMRNGAIDTRDAIAERGENLLLRLRAAAKTEAAS